MSNQLQSKAASLAQILAANKLTKSAEQDITHTEPTAQTNLGKEQTQEIKKYVEGDLAFTDAAKNAPKDQVQEIPGAQSLNATPESALAATGTKVENIAPCGCPTGTPQEQAKKASDFRTQLAQILKKTQQKQAAKAQEAPVQKQASFTEADFRTGTEVMEKFASLTPNSTQEDIAAAQEDLIKLANTNPVFGIIRNRIIQSKMAADIDALAEAEGITPEEAAAELQSAADEDPTMMAALEDEANGEAVAELAEAEAATDDLMTEIQNMADTASQTLGEEVTPDDILAAAEETDRMAAELGVPPEVLIQAALDEMQAEAGAGVEVTPEDEANAQQILDAAAAQGVSPEEVIQMATNELEGGSDVPEEAAAAPAAEEPKEEPTEKAASLQKRAGTMRAEFVRQKRAQRNNK